MGRQFAQKLTDIDIHQVADGQGTDGLRLGTECLLGKDQDRKRDGNTLIARTGVGGNGHRHATHTDVACCTRIADDTGHGILPHHARLELTLEHLTEVETIVGIGQISHLGDLLIHLGTLQQELEGIERTLGGELIYLGNGQIGLVLAVVLGSQGATFVEKHLVVALDVDHIGVILGDDDLGLMVAGYGLDFGINDFERIACSNHRPTLVGHELPGTCAIVGSDVLQQFQAQFRLASQRTQGDGGRYTYHSTGVGDTHTHGKLDDITTQFGFHHVGFLAQDLTRLGTSQSHHPRLVATDGW